MGLLRHRPHIGSSEHCRASKDHVEGGKLVVKLIFVGYPYLLIYSFILAGGDLEDRHSLDLPSVPP